MNLVGLACFAPEWQQADDADKIGFSIGAIQYCGHLLASACKISESKTQNRLEGNWEWA